MATFQIEGLHNKKIAKMFDQEVVATRNAARLQIEGLHNKTTFWTCF